MTPSTEKELSEAIANATGPLKIVGGGTRPIGNPVTGEVLSTARLSAIELYEPGALTIVAKAGTPLSEIEAALAKENQRLAFEPMDHRAILGTSGTPTIGGVVAANISGPRRIQSGACRDSLIGVRFVDGQGTILKNGGRVMKNVTGYDLVKLMAGSYGTLGVISEVAFKVLPGVETEATISIAGLDEVAAIEAMSLALGSPYEVSGAAYGPFASDGAGTTYLRLEGFETSVKYRCDKLKAALKSFGDIQVETDPERSAALWRDLRDVNGLSKFPFVARMSIKPSDFPDLHCSMSQSAPHTSQLDWGGGLVWLAANESQLIAAARHAGYHETPANGVISFMEMLQSYCADRGGHASLVKAPPGHGFDQAFQPQPAPLAAISDGLRAKFDPRGILNPGLMG